MFLTQIYLLNTFLLDFLGFCCCSCSPKMHCILGCPSLDPSTLHIFTTFRSWWLWKSCLSCKPPRPLLSQPSQWQLLIWLDFSTGTRCCCHPLHGKLSFGSWYVVPDQVCDVVELGISQSITVWESQLCLVTKEICHLWNTPIFCPIPTYHYLACEYSLFVI